MNTVATTLNIPTLGATTRAISYGAQTGSPVVLVHGFRGDHHGLDGIARAIVARAPELRAIVPDLPGFGKTHAVPGRTHDLDLYGEWLKSFTAAEEVGASGFAILGHSFGSLVVANALSQGMSPHSTTLINPISAPALDGPQAIATKLASGYYRLAALLPEAAARALLSNPQIVRLMSEFMAKTRDRSLRVWIHEQHDQYFSQFSDSTTLLDAFRASVSHTVVEYVDAFRAPTLLIVGDKDDITPLNKQLELTRRMRDARLRIAPGVGHLVHYEAVSFAADEIISFLRVRQGS